MDKILDRERRKGGLVRGIFSLVFLLVGMLVATAQVKVAPNSKIFITPMDGDLHGFIAAEIIRQELPLLVIREEKDADFILTGASVTKESKWYQVVFQGAGDKTQGSVQLFDSKNEALVWASATSDRSWFMGNLKREGPHKVALRLVKKMNKDLFKKKVR